MLREIQNFMDISFGLRSPSPRPFVKLPHALLLDYSIDGPAELIVRTALEFLREQDWQALDLTTGDMITVRASEGLALLRRIEAALKQRGLLERPAVFLPPGPGPGPALQTPALAALVASLGGRVVSTAEEATHILAHDPEIESILAIAEDFVQPLDARLAARGAGRAWVHWWYYPACYDEWVSQLEVGAPEAPGEHPQVPPGPARAWRVNHRFLCDAAQFNEWGNEADYLVEGPDKAAAAAEEVGPDAGSSPPKKRAKGSSGGGHASSAARELLAAAAPRGGARAGDALPVAGALPGATDKAYVDLQPPTSAANPCTGGRVAVAHVRGAVDELEDVVLEPAPAAAVPAADTAYDTAPSSAPARGPPAWYAADSVREPELQFLAALLGSQANARKVEDYLRIREHLVATYRLSPAVRLSATDARRRIAADAAFVVKVHGFLDAHCVINCSVLPENVPHPAAADPLAPLLVKPMPASAAAASWHEGWDAALLAHAHLAGAGTGAGAGAGAGHGWAGVAAAVSAQVLTAVSAVQCMTRFAQMDSVQLAARQQARAGGHLLDPARLAALSSGLASRRLSAFATLIAHGGGGGGASGTALPAAEWPAPAPAPLSLFAGDVPLAAALEALQARVELARRVELALGRERQRLEVDRRNALHMRARVAAFGEYR